MQKQQQQQRGEVAASAVDLLSALFLYWNSEQMETFLVAINALLWSPPILPLPPRPEHAALTPAEQAQVANINELYREYETEMAHYARSMTIVTSSGERIALRGHVRNLMQRLGERNTVRILEDGCSSASSSSSSSAERDNEDTTVSDSNDSLRRPPTAAFVMPSLPDEPMLNEVRACIVLLLLHDTRIRRFILKHTRGDFGFVECAPPIARVDSLLEYAAGLERRYKQDPLQFPLDRFGDALREHWLY